MKNWEPESPFPGEGGSDGNTIPETSFGSCNQLASGPKSARRSRRVLDTDRAGIKFSKVFEHHCDGRWAEDAGKGEF